jgi:hypothetical protein
MPFIFNNRAVSHLIKAVDSGDTELRITQADFEQFNRYGAGSDDFMFCVLRGPTDREIVKIIPSQVNYAPDPYLVCERGQGGTPAEAWPAGTLIFLCTVADHYSELIQPDAIRQIEFNPNGVLSPNYAGEKVFQYAGCAVRWWQSFNATDPYWHLIAGEPCPPDEEFVNPTGTFVSKVWFVTFVSCWQQWFNNFSWQPGHIDTVWDGSRWVDTTGPTVVRLSPPIGTWYPGFRPQIMKAYRSLAGNCPNVQLRQAGGGILVNHTGVYVGDEQPDGLKFEIPSANYNTAVVPFTADLDQFDITGNINGEVELTNLEFFECESDPLTPLYDAYIHNQDPVYSISRDAAVANNMSDTSTFMFCGSNHHTGTLYTIQRIHLFYDLSGVTIDDIREAALRIRVVFNSIPPTLDKLCIQEGTAGSYPVTLNDWQAQTGPLLADPVPNVGAAVAVRIYTFWLNDFGKNYLASKLGGTAEIVIRNYEHDYINLAPVAETGTSYIDSMEAVGTWARVPRLTIYGNTT